MHRKSKINEKWIKASILGTIWASSEIVFGSFLHNLKIPFSGNLLTGIGLVILISVSYIWTEKGLFWRAGLITAIMKTMSPSAVIFGPMIAILTESVLLEASTRIFGRTVLGYLLGAALAMSWNLFQKIINFIIFYGYNIVELYTNLVEMAQKKLNIQVDIVWFPIFLLLIIYVVLGIIAGHLGMITGRRLQKRSTIEGIINESVEYPAINKTAQPGFEYSFMWLILNILFIIGALVLLSIADWKIWIFAIPALVIIWSMRYRRALRQIARPKFWIYFVIITTLITLVFTNETSIGERLIIGLQMNFRAAVIILGFTVTGTELYNPRIRAFFKKSSFKQLPIALELSFESLPSAIANIPDVKSIMRNPGNILYQIISQAENRLSEINAKRTFLPQIFIISGSIGQGKTSCVKKIAEILRTQKINIEGILSVRVMEEDKTTGYDIVDIKSGERKTFLRSTGQESFERIGNYFIYPEGIKRGNEILQNSGTNDCDLVIIDEVGRLELDNRGWAGSLRDLLSSSCPRIFLTVRDSFVEGVIKKFGLDRAKVFAVTDHKPESIVESLGIIKVAG